MKLHSITYSQFERRPTHWKFDELTLGKTNLLVGMNASGKTRTLNVIHNFALRLSGARKQLFRSGSYQAHFRRRRRGGEDQITYSLDLEGGEVVGETLSIGGKRLLHRTKSGKGTVWAEKLREDFEFQVPKTELASVAKRDTLQHPFLERLNKWAKSVVYLRCGTDMGKSNMLAVGDGRLVKGEFAASVDKPIDTFLSGCKRFGKGAFTAPIKRDMKAIGYSIRKISVGPPPSISIATNLGEVVSLNVQERDLKCETDQNSMSEGMFRAFALILHLNYAVLDGSPYCLLIDDIGEGLDYERSRSLIEVVRERVKGSSGQLVMATNNRLVMNSVPLSEWQIIERHGHVVQFYNSENSKDAFEEFEFTGLSNFDLFRYDLFADQR